MRWYSKTLYIQTTGQGLHSFTDQITSQLLEWGVREGMAFLFVQHTSASLVINENYDPTAKSDMEQFLDRIAPEGGSWYEHTTEGKDDSPSHMRTMITPTSMTIPIDNSKLNLGTWQGIYLAEHRQGAHQRHVLLHVLDVSLGI